MGIIAKMQTEMMKANRDRAKVELPETTAEETIAVAGKAPIHLIDLLKIDNTLPSSHHCGCRVGK